MKQLQLSFVLILVASVVILSAENPSANSKQSAAPTSSQASPIPPTGVEQENQANSKTTDRYDLPTEPFKPFRTTPPSTDSQKQTSDGKSPEWYKSQVLSNWALVVVAVVGAYIALRTLSSIDRQVMANRRAAAAARVNARAVMLGQRAQVIVTVVRDGPGGYKISGLKEGGNPTVEVRVDNGGPTPAYNCRITTWINILNDPLARFADGTGTDFADGDIPIFANTPDPLIMSIQLGRIITWQENDDIVRTGTSYLCFRVVVNYLDFFEKSRHASFAWAFNGKRGLVVMPHYSTAD